MSRKFMQYICIVILISKISCDKPDKNMTDEDSIIEEDNEIKDQYHHVIKNPIHFAKEYENKESRESFEQVSVDLKAKNISNVTKQIHSSAEDENDADEDEDNKIDDSKNVISKGASVTAKDKSSDEETSERNGELKIMTALLIKEQPSHNYNDTAKKMLFRNCRDRETDDLCRNTLIDYPYTVSILKLGSHYATGTLLNHRWILSVAGEFYNVRESIKLFRARLGSVNCKKGGISIPLQEVIVHPLFVPGEPGYDLGLLRLGQRVEFSHFIKPINLSTAQEKVLSANFLTTYWPRLIINGVILPRNASERAKPTSLRVSTQKLISEHYCHNMMLDMNINLKESSLCLKPLVAHHSLCLPDPGAPLVADDGLWGITSGWVSKLCYKLPGPTIFTRTSSPLVRSWLDSKLSIN